MKPVSGCGTPFGALSAILTVKHAGKPGIHLLGFPVPVQYSQEEEKIVRYSLNEWKVMEIASLRLADTLTKNRLYLRGPIPLEWISKAACLPGRVLHVGLALWHLSALKREKVVKMQGKILKSFGISRGVYKKGLDQLSEIGLVSVERKPGSTPIVTILDANR
jgi:hypothetical protein